MWIRSDRIIGSRDAWHVIGADQSWLAHVQMQVNHEWGTESICPYSSKRSDGGVE
jgi:hypothetical protein